VHPPIISGSSGRLGVGLRYLAFCVTGIHRSGSQSASNHGDYFYNQWRSSRWGMGMLVS
jgi:hypothetical protein